MVRGRRARGARALRTASDATAIALNPAGLRACPQRATSLLCLVTAFSPQSEYNERERFTGSAVTFAALPRRPACARKRQEFLPSPNLALCAPGPAYILALGSDIPAMAASTTSYPDASSPEQGSMQTWTAGAGAAASEQFGDTALTSRRLFKYGSGARAQRSKVASPSQGVAPILGLQFFAAHRAAGPFRAKKSRMMGRTSRSMITVILRKAGRPRRDRIRRGLVAALRRFSLATLAHLHERF